MLESNPPRNSQLETHRGDERGRDSKVAPFSSLHHFDRSPDALENSCSIHQSNKNSVENLLSALGLIDIGTLSIRPQRGRARKLAASTSRH
jgi:hypothetical protein